MMRVKRIQTSNFAGIGSVELCDLDDRHEIFVSGRNGIGKSQLLLCVAIAARGDVSAHEAAKYIGSEGSSARIAVDFVLSVSEIAELNSAIDGRSSDFVGPTLRAEVQLHRLQAPTHEWFDAEGGDDFSWVLMDPIARSGMSFIDVTYLPADRVVARSPDLTFSLQSLARSKSVELGQQTLLQQLSDWGQSHSFDVFSGLAALHYAGVLAKTEGATTSPQLDDFRSIVDAFQRATGKTIEEPRIKPDGSIGLDVRGPDGQTHGVNMLSSGELLALQLLHFVKVHFQQGTILLIDEPETHLHPSLQVEVARAVRAGVGPGQLWIVTHSPNLLNVVPGRDVLVLGREQNSGRTVATFADSKTKQIDLLEALGVAAGLWVPGNSLTIVEGASDELYLRQLLPDQVATTYFVVAGNGSSVRSISSRMQENQSLPFLAITDRDRRTDEELAKWNANESQFMWTGYAIETLFLDEAWLCATLIEAEPTWSPAEVSKELARVFESQKARVLDLWLREEIVRMVPSEDDHRVGIQESIAKAGEIAAKRAAFVDAELDNLKSQFEAEWTSDPRRFVDPKRALGEFRSQVYQSKELLVRAMITKLAREPELAPADLVRLRAKLQGIAR